MRNLIPDAIKLITGAEKCSLKQYHGSADPPDVWTIGWGHVIRSNESWLKAGISQAQADKIFSQDADSHTKYIQLDIGSAVVFDDFEYGALASLAFNNGPRTYAAAPSIVGPLRIKSKQGYLNFWKFCKSGKPLQYRDGLFYRRLMESYFAVAKKRVAKPDECNAARKLIGELSKFGDMSEALKYFNQNHVRSLCITCRKH